GRLRGIEILSASGQRRWGSRGWEYFVWPCEGLARCGRSTPPGSAIGSDAPGQIGARAGDDEAMSVPSEPAIARLGKAEDPLDGADRMLDLGPQPSIWCGFWRARPGPRRRDGGSGG